MYTQSQEELRSGHGQAGTCNTPRVSDAVSADDLESIGMTCCFVFLVGWAQEERYRLSIKDIENSDSGTFTCTSPRGLTNSIAVAVATSTCPQLSEPVPPLTLRLEGNKLGQRALYRCPSGYRVDGVANSTCLASGNWSSPPPTCHAVQCPRLILDDPHLSLVELNTSAWGRAVFKCQWGFKLTGPPGLECNPTGAWSGPVPRCRGK